MTERDEFSVIWWDREGGQHEELRFVSPRAAVKAARRLTTGPAVQLGMVKRVISPTRRLLLLRVAAGSTQ